MGRGSDRRATAAAVRAEQEEALRRGIDEVLRVKKEGDLGRAADLAIKLVGAHPKSAAPYNLVGFVMECAAENVQDQVDRFPALHPSRLGPEEATDEEGIVRGFQIDEFTPEDLVRLSGGDADGGVLLEEELARRSKERADAMADLAVYLQTCAQWYSKAANLAPRCVFTRASYARSLGLNEQTAEAHHEFTSALRIQNPDLPQKHNPWLKSTSQPATDDEQKRLVMSNAQQDFDRFLHLADQRVYRVCKDLLLNIQSQATTIVSAKRKATELAVMYPFSARAALIEPFLMRQLIEASSSSVPKLKHYQQLLHDIADTVDLFPSSLVMCLFKAELLYSMGHYLEASMECIRGLKIRRPDDPVSEDVPPGWASGAGPTARIASAVAKIMDLMEQIEKQISDPEDIKKLLHGLRLESRDALAANNRGKRLVDNLNSKLLQHASHKAAEPVSTEQKARKQTYQDPSKRHKDQRHNRNSNDETDDPIEDAELKMENVERVRPQQIVESKIYSKETVDTYAEYCYLRSLCSVKKDICHLCVFEEQDYYNNIVPKGSMIHHCVKLHQAASTLECGESTCGARFKSKEDEELHQHYCHFLDKDWWIQWRHR